MKGAQALKAKVMLWTDISCDDMEEVDNMQSIPDLESVLCNVLGVDLPEPKRGVLLELYVQTVLFCRRCSFKKEQTSALLSIIKSIHEANTGTSHDNIEQCSKYYKELLLLHSVRRPPFSINLFSSKEVNCVFNYIHNTYMRHYKLYKYIFTPQVKLDLCFTYSGNPDRDDGSAPEGAEAVPRKESSPEIQETSITDQAEPTLDPTQEMKALIEKEVRQQMMLVLGKLDQRMKEIADQQLNSAFVSPQPNDLAKK